MTLDDGAEVLTARPGEGAVATTSDGARPESEALARESDIAADYVERLLDILDLEGEFDLDVVNGRPSVSVVEGHDLDRLVGARGAVLDALQELTRRAVERETGVRSRLMLDIDGYREKRRADLTDLGLRTARAVVTDGESVTLEPMNPFERKVVHDAVASVSGAASASVGEEPQRRVVVRPTDVAGD